MSIRSNWKMLDNRNTPSIENRGESLSTLIQSFLFSMGVARIAMVLGCDVRESKFNSILKISLQIGCVTSQNDSQLIYFHIEWP